MDQSDGEALVPVNTSPEPPSTRPAGGTVGAQTLERGLDMLEQIVARPIRMPALIRQSGLSKTTTWRLVQALADRRFVSISPSGEVHAGPKLLQLGARTQEQTDLLLIARRYLDELAASTGHSAFLGRRDGEYSVHLHRSPGNERVAVTTAPGTRRRIAETSLGRALLLDEPTAALHEALRASGREHLAPEWIPAMAHSAADGSVLNEGAPPDCINAIAAPIRDVTGRIVAAISIASASTYLGVDRMHALAPAVREAGKEISRALGWKDPL